MPKRQSTPLEPVTSRDYGTEVASIVLMVMYLVGSICFLQGFQEWVYHLAAWLFIVASFGVTIQAAIPFLRSLKSSHRTSWNDLTESELELLNFAVAGFLFFLGTFAFVPNIFREEHVFWGTTVGAWLFITGSFGFLEATFWNAIGLRADFCKGILPDWHQRNCSRLTNASLFASLHGCALFLIGSVLFRPAFVNGCESLGYNEGREWCQSPAQAATWCYIAGSVFFVVQSLLGLANSIVSDRGHRSQANVAMGQEKPRATSAP